MHIYNTKATSKTYLLQLKFKQSHYYFAILYTAETDTVNNILMETPPLQYTSNFHAPNKSAL